MNRFEDFIPCKISKVCKGNYKYIYQVSDKTTEKYFIMDEVLSSSDKTIFNQQRFSVQHIMNYHVPSSNLVQLRCSLVDSPKQYTVAKTKFFDLCFILTGRKLFILHPLKETKELIYRTALDLRASSQWLHGRIVQKFVASTHHILFEAN